MTSSGQTITSKKDSAKTPLVIKATLPDGYEPIDTQTLKMLFAVKEKLESENAAANQLIETYKEAIANADATISNQSSIIKKYEDNEALYKIDAAAFDKTINNLSKENKRLGRQVKLFKGLSIGLPAAGIATAGYFLFIK